MGNPLQKRRSWFSGCPYHAVTSIGDEPLKNCSAWMVETFHVVLKTEEARFTDVKIAWHLEQSFRHPPHNNKNSQGLSQLISKAIVRRFCLETTTKTDGVWSRSRLCTLYSVKVTWNHPTTTPERKQLNLFNLLCDYYRRQKTTIKNDRFGKYH